jgi:tRNA A37 methylthiotransferase MiaB
MPEKLCRMVTLGCKVNQYETQLVLEALEKNGFREAQDDETADLCVVNTCTVTSNGDSRSRQVIRQLAKHNPGTRTLVMGCYATRDSAAVQKLPAVSSTFLWESAASKDAAEPTSKFKTAAFFAAPIASFRRCDLVCEVGPPLTSKRKCAG